MLLKLYAAELGKSSSAHTDPIIFGHQLLKLHKVHITVARCPDCPDCVGLTAHSTHAGKVTK